MSDDIIKNVNKSVIYISGGNLIAGFVLLYIYSVTDEIWFLIAAIAMLIGAILYIFVIIRYKSKLEKILKEKKDETV